MLYHVSSTSGIKVLTPRVSTHGKAYVYAIDNLVTGLLFGARKDDFDFLLSTDENGTPHVYECYPDAFHSVYDGKSCSVYELADEGFLRGMTSWSPEVVCEREVSVLREVYVANLKEALLDEEAKGNLVIHRYQDDAAYKKLISAHIVDRIVRFGMMDQPHLDSRFQKHFGKIVQELRLLMDGYYL